MLGIVKCPSCNIEMEPLVAGIYQCPNCRKIIKERDKSVEDAETEEVKKGEFQGADAFPRLNPEYEIVEKGILVQSTNTRVIAVLICHSSILKEEKYVRISWWKTYQHAGMFKIYNRAVLQST